MCKFVSKLRSNFDYIEATELRIVGQFYVNLWFTMSTIYIVNAILTVHVQIWLFLRAKIYFGAAGFMVKWSQFCFLKMITFCRSKNSNFDNPVPKWPLVGHAGPDLTDTRFVSWPWSHDYDDFYCTFLKGLVFRNPRNRSGIGQVRAGVAD